MNNGSLLERAAARQRTAIAILGELALVERWRPFGEPVLCGAAAYELLVEPDIDLEINCLIPSIEAGFSILAACAQLPNVRNARFTNALDDPDAGLYWQLRYRADDGQKWKIDMWSLPLDHPGPRSQDLVAPLRAALDDASRSRILTLKEGLVATDVVYRSIDVYRAALDFGVATLEDFIVWNRLHGGSGLTNWRPRAAVASRHRQSSVPESRVEKP